MKAPLLAAALLLLFFGSLAAAGDIPPPVRVAARADRLQTCPLYPSHHADVTLN